MEGNNLFDELRDEVEKYTVIINNSNGLNNHSEAKRIDRELQERIFGQDRPIRRLVRAVSIFEAKLNDPQRPIGCWILAGPSGVGKTFTGKEFGHLWIGEPEEGLDPVVLIACGDLTLEHQITSLTGAPPSYVGYNDKPALASVGEYDKYKKTKGLEERSRAWINKINKRFLGRGLPHRIAALLDEKINEIHQQYAESLKPFRSVVIFDELEKAHPNVQKELLNILEEGKIRLQNGTIVDFTGSIIFLTTNIGTPQVVQEYLGSRQIGFHPPRKKTEDGKNINLAIYERICEEVEKQLPPELLSRIGGRKGIVVFHVLQKEHYLKILDRELTKIQDMLSGKPSMGPEAPVLLAYSSEFKEFLLRKAESPKYGARILRNVVDKYVKEPLAQKITSGKIRIGDKLLFTVKVFQRKSDEGKVLEEGKVIIRRQPRPKNGTFAEIGLRKSEGSLIDIEKVMNDLLEKLMSSIPQKPLENQPDNSPPKRS